VPSTYGSGLAADVSPESALRQSMVWRCVRASSYDMGSLSIILYRQLERGKERAKTHPLYDILHLAPNGWMTPFLFEQLAQVHILLRGMFYARIIENSFGEVQALIPMNPDRVKPQLLPSGRLGFTHRKTDGGTETLTQEQVHYRTGLTLDGIRGMSCIEASAPTLARAMAAEGYATDFFSGGAAPPFYLKHPLTLGADATERLKKSLREYKAGDKYLILEEAMEAQSLGVSARRAAARGPAAQRRADRRDLRHARAPRRHHEARVGELRLRRERRSRLREVRRRRASEGERRGDDAGSAVGAKQNRYVIEYCSNRCSAATRGPCGVLYSARRLEAITPNEIRERENMNPLPDGDGVIKNVVTPPAEHAPRSEGAADGTERSPGARDHRRGRGARRREGNHRGDARGPEAREAIRTAGRSGAGTSTTITPGSSGTC
jgi:hypothetical protein